MRNALTLPAALAALTLTLGAAACGSNEGDPEPEIPGGADAEAVEVINGWSTALREGRVEEAADFFAVPSVAQNGTPPLSLRTRDDVVAFNEALPCGAELVEAVEDGGFVVATFTLTERPGEGECGDGVGEEARTAFVIEDGEIAEWRRAPIAPSAEPPSDQPVV